jgi:hypothetical protein
MVLGSGTVTKLLVACGKATLGSITKTSDIKISNSFRINSPLSLTIGYGFIF